MKLIGLSGISGSGKTHLLKKIQSDLGGQVSVLSFDNYYKPIEYQQKDENGFENFDLPSGVDIEKFLKDVETLKRRESLRIKVYQFNKPGAVDTYIDIHPAPVLMVEGIFVFHFPSLFIQLDHKIYVHSTNENSLNRRLKRDLAERGLSEEMNLYQWEQHALPGFEKYVTLYKDKADLVLHNDENTSVAYEQLRAFLESLIS